MHAHSPPLHCSLTTLSPLHWSADEAVSIGINVIKSGGVHPQCNGFLQANHAVAICVSCSHHLSKKIVNVKPIIAIKGSFCVCCRLGCSDNSLVVRRILLFSSSKSVFTTPADGEGCDDSYVREIQKISSFNYCNSLFYSRTNPFFWTKRLRSVAGLFA